MNLDQILSAARWILATFGPLIVSHGLVGSATWEIVAGGIISAIPLIWGLVTHTDTSKITAAANTPGVQAVVMNTPSAANAIPDPKVVAPPVR